VARVIIRQHRKRLKWEYKRSARYYYYYLRRHHDVSAIFAPSTLGVASGEKWRFWRGRAVGRRTAQVFLRYSIGSGGAGGLGFFRVPERKAPNVFTARLQRRVKGVYNKYCRRRARRSRFRLCGRRFFVVGDG